ncbi:MAG: glycoside hydrolase family 2 [Chloroflexi bacterium]|nr:MAG: glycoside hydrolase family 2 [Chloroflexota bacterium]
MQEKSETIHPRPQLSRAQWLDLGGTWGFTYDDTNCGQDEKWQEREDVFTRTIQVPFPPESAASGIGDTNFHPIVWYRRTFQVPDEYASKRLLLHCGAVDYSTQVWVNGQLVAVHEGGQTPFTADITSVLRPEGEQVVVIRAEDMPLDLTQPRGKQDWQEHPHTIWYHRTTGIWQPIWLEPVSATHITQVRWVPDLDQGLLSMTISLQRQDNTSVQIRVRLSQRGNELADDLYMMQGIELQRHIAVDQSALMSREHLLWSPEHPNLIDVVLTVFEDNTIVDKVQSYVGLRSVGTGNGRFMLNGHPYYLRLVLEQGYWPQSHLAAPGDEALRREVELIKALGFNGVRIHQKVEDPRFLYWCDRLGLLVWGEMANAYIFSPKAIQRLTREWLAVLERNYNHPCIVAWVPFNESWGVSNLARDPAQRHYVQAIYHLTKAIDTTRPTIGNDGWEHLVSDIYGIHDYTFNGSTICERYGSAQAVEKTLHEVQPSDHAVILPGHRREGEPIMLTECGGIGYRPDANQPWFGYGTVADSEAFLKKYEELIDAIVKSPAIAGFCYTQLTDTEQETNGLLTADRRPKLDLAAVHSITTRTAAAIPEDINALVQNAQEELAPTDQSAPSQAQ